MRLIRVILAWLALRTILGVGLVSAIAHSFVAERPGRHAFDELKQKLEHLPSTLSEIGRVLRKGP